MQKANDGEREGGWEKGIPERKYKTQGRKNGASSDGSESSGKIRGKKGRLLLHRERERVPGKRGGREGVAGKNGWKWVE